MRVNLERYLEELEVLTNMDSGQGNPDGISAVGDFFADRFSAMGWLVEKHDVGRETGYCLVVKNREAAHYDVMLIGHIDTVFETGEAAKRPFRRDGETCYGVGVIDMKQGCLAMQHILESLPAEVNSKLNIMAVFNPDEEILSRYSRTLTDRLAAQCDYVYVFEAGGNDGEITIERKGQTQGEVAIYGRAGHAGYPFDGKSLSAVQELLHWMNALYEFHSADIGTGVNIGVIRAGEKSNIIPHTAQFAFDIRYEKAEEYHRLQTCFEALRRHAEGRGYRVEFSHFHSTPPLVPDERTWAYVERMKVVAQRIGYPFALKKRGGLSDANHLAQMGPICIDSLGPTGDFDHSADEYLDIATVQPMMHFAYALLCELADGKQ